jgi:hypothetical protein
MQELHNFLSEFPKWNLDMAFLIKDLVLDLHITIAPWLKDTNHSLETVIGPN